MGKLNFGARKQDRSALRKALEAGYSKTHVSVGGYDSDGRISSGEIPFGIGETRYYIGRSERGEVSGISGMSVYGVYRTDFGRFVIEESVWKVEGARVEAMDRVGEYGQETIAWRSFVGNSVDFSEIHLSFTPTTPQSYAVETKRLAMTIRQTFEVGKMGRTYKPLPGDSIQFPETE